MAAEPFEDRFWARVDMSHGIDGCWPWLGYVRPDGYGTVMCGTSRRDNRCRQAHRVAYELLIGPIPEGLQIDHLCRSRACVNPAHMEPVTVAENLRRGNANVHNLIKTHCPQGHPYDEDNTKYRGPRRHRECKACAVEAVKRYKQRKSAERATELEAA